jgi:uncharacterized protein
MADRMRIGLIADTHGSAAGYAAAVDAIGKADLMLHAGDYISDARVMAQRTGIPTIYVGGNCDYPPKEDEKERELYLCGFNLLLVHGHRQSVKRSYDQLFEYAAKRNFDICVFGHTHMHLIQRENGCFFVNPGSPHSPRMGGPTCAVLTLQKGEPPSAEIIPLVIRR